MRRLGIMACLAAVSGCATPAWDDSTPVQCRVRNASVTLLCTAGSDGVLHDCAVAEESAPGCGFAEAALETATKGNFRSNGARREGEAVRFTLRFRTAD